MSIIQRQPNKMESIMMYAAINRFPRCFLVVMKSAVRLVIALIAFGAIGKSSAPVGLLVDGVSHPLAIDCGSARYAWMSKDDNRGERQTAYQILVASSPERLAAGKADWWDSGKLDSDQSASVVYAGKVLPSATRFWWEVRTWEQTGKAGPYGAPAYFDTGLNDWPAHYIWDGTTNLNNFACFRKTFVVTNMPRPAKVYVTGHNDYLLFFNGNLLRRGPARCNPYPYGQYNAYDITKLVKTGSNVFAAVMMEQ
jgi:alpha-L-rhamnosidase